MGATTRKAKKEKILITPPTGVSESGGSILIVSQLHGIPEDTIRIDLEKKQLSISATTPDSIVLRTISVPEGSRISKKKFHEGILEITLEIPQ